MRQHLINAKVRIEGEKRILHAETCLSEGGYIIDLPPEERDMLITILNKEEEIDRQIEDDEYAAAYDICQAKFPDFL